MKTRKSDTNKQETQKEGRFKVEKYPPRGIPRQVLSRTLEITNNSDDPFWLNKNTSCVAPIGYVSNNSTKISETSKKLNLATNCLMTRDFKNLARLMTSNLISDTSVQKGSYPIFTEYASILLNTLDPELLSKLQLALKPSNILNSQNSISEDA